MRDYASELKSCQKLVEEELNTYFIEACAQSELLEAMRYSLLAGGKRIRPVLLLKFCEASGGETEEALSAACGIEMLHTYSLIHDDLPCMDNDALRRGKPTCHIVYGETNAVLAGDALQAAAFQAVLSGSAAAKRRADMALILAEAAGEAGMCGGQYLDMAVTGGETDEEGLHRLQLLKTGALLSAACRMGAVCGGASAEQLAAAALYAENVGLAFQIRDDMLDVISSTDELGKPVGSDSENGKVTFATLLGLDECEKRILSLTETAQNAVADAFDDPGFLLWLAETLARRSR